MDKPWYQSLTMWGGIVVAGIQAAEAGGAMPAGTGVGVANFVQALAGLVALYGLRRAVKPAA